jgi:hypothetical protein
VFRCVQRERSAPLTGAVADAPPAFEGAAGTPFRGEPASSEFDWHFNPILFGCRSPRPATRAAAVRGEEARPPHPSSASREHVSPSFIPGLSGTQRDARVHASRDGPPLGGAATSVTCARPFTESYCPRVLFTPRFGGMGEWRALQSGVVTPCYSSMGRERTPRSAE